MLQQARCKDIRRVLCWWVANQVAMQYESQPVLSATFCKDAHTITGLPSKQHTCVHALANADGRKQLAWQYKEADKKTHHTITRLSSVLQGLHVDQQTLTVYIMALSPGMAMSRKKAVSAAIDPLAGRCS
jgi:hypothetical protein